MAKLEWTEDEVARLRELAAQGMSSPQIWRTGFPDRTLPSVRNKLTMLGIPVTHPMAAVQAAKAERLAELVARADYDPVPEWLEKLRPVQMPAPAPAAVAVAPGDFTLIAGDFHFPQHCERSIGVFLETVRQLKPRRVILNGDTVDLLAVSKYPKDQRHTWDLREEVTAFHGFLHQLMSIGNAWGMTVLETEANHSGNATGASCAIGTWRTAPCMARCLSFPLTARWSR